MSKIKLTESTYAVCPEGVHIFKITEVQQDNDFQVITLKLKTPDGYTDTERYTLINSDGSANDGALGAFSYLAKCAMHDMTLTEIEPTLLKNCYIKATISHTVKASTKREGKTVTFTSISDIESATEAEWAAGIPAKTPPTAPISKPTVKTSAGFDLDALFGRK
jgi:hypothetical protein